MWFVLVEDRATVGKQVAESHKGNMPAIGEESGMHHRELHVGCFLSSPLSGPELAADTVAPQRTTLLLDCP